MAQTMFDQVEVAEAVDAALELVDEPTSLFELVKNAVPHLSDDSIRNYLHYVVNGVKVENCDMEITKEDTVKVVPMFAGGN